MRSTRAIFTKQAKDILRNPMVLVMFIIFPAVAFIMTELVAKSNPDIPNNMFVAMMAPIFAGMALVTSTSGLIAEDIERKSLRFLIMAGVKPHEYLAGTTGFNLLAGAVVSIVFGLIGDFTGLEFAKFSAAMVAGVAASVMLGAAIGMCAENTQAATALSMPFAMIIGFVPMIAQFNESVRKVSGILYTQQLNILINDFSADFAQAMLIIGANAAVLAVLFILVYRRKRLRL